HINSNQHVSSEEVVMAKSAIKEESSLSDPSKEKASKSTQSNADKLASAAKTKKTKLYNDANVSANTKALTKEQGVAKNNKQSTPNLV
ncbi:smooth muscle caldesmon, partial [Staphylococcus haemolyticus]